MQQLAPNQTSPEVVINDNFGTLSHQAVYGKRQPATSGLTWGYYGGRWSGFSIADGTVTLTASTTNYLVVATATGVLSTSTSATNWNDSTNYARVYKLTTGIAVVTAVEDHRAGAAGIGGGIGGGTARGLADGNYGDITASGSGASLTIDPAVLSTYGRSLIASADAAASRTALILGTAASLASDTDATLAANSDTRLATQKAVKTAIAAATAALTTAQGANKALCGPASGSDATASYRALVIADLPFAAIAGGVATLGSDGKVLAGQLPASVLGSLSYQGTWNASTNSPSITTGGSSSTNKGYYYKVAVAGSTTVDGNSDWGIGDWIVSDGTKWDKVDNTEGISSVAGLVGAISAISLKSELNLAGTNSGDETAASIAALVHGASSKNILVDADEFTGTDSAASFGLIRYTWANIKSALKTYFDTLYGYRGIPQNSQGTDYTLVLDDAGKHIYHPAADTMARTWTIAANSSVSFPIGTAITFDNDYDAGVVTIAITDDTLVLVGTIGSIGARTLASGGQATAIKVSTTRWRINGTGLT